MIVTVSLLLIGLLLAVLVVVGVRQTYMLALASRPRPKRPRLAALIYLADNPLSYAGLFLVNSAAVTWIWVMPVMFKEGTSHPYLGIFFIAILPMLFVAGLALLPIGAWYRYRRQLAKGIYPDEFKPLSWDNPAFRRVGVFVVAVTGLNVLVGGYYSQTAVKYMDSSTFCGTTCHTMTPEWTAYQDSPHKNVPCVECHVGSGRRAKLESKVNGLRQVWMMARNSYSRPIPTPVHNLRPAREICESCHWPEKFSGVSMQVLDKFEEDEHNTASKTVIVQLIGGGNVTTGIHGFHVAPGIVIEYRADEERQVIPWVRYTEASGEATEYVTEDWDPASAQEFELRTMDCMDCHTRPSHQFQLPRRALGGALGAGLIDPSLPWIYKVGLEILDGEFP
ncbi:MAG: NapC/NirT family cytochrome c, partial [Gemmatimonadales bacterium]